MPWTTKDVSRFTKAATTPKRKRQWVRVANGALRRCLSDGGSVRRCEASAIRQANGVVSNTEIDRAEDRGDRTTRDVLVARRVESRRQEERQRRRRARNERIAMPDSLFFLNAELDGACREETLHGDLYLVRPVKIVRSMVLNGLGDGPKGGQLLPQDELDRCPIAAWNNIPLTLGHPFAMNEDVKQYRSANSQDMLQRFQVGMILNAHRDNQQRIAGEAWLHADNCELAGGEAASLVKLFRANAQAEVSSAYHFRLDETTGTHDGTAFNAIQRDIHPDHVAILLGSAGACNNEDGCGLGVNATCGPACDCAECQATYSGPLASMAAGIEKLVRLFTGGDSPSPKAVATNTEGGEMVEEIKTLDELYAAKEIDDSVKAQVRESIAFHQAETARQAEAREARVVELAANERVTFTLDELRTMSDPMLDKVAESAKEPAKAPAPAPRVTYNQHESPMANNRDDNEYTWVGGSTIPQNN